MTEALDLALVDLGSAISAVWREFDGVEDLDALVYALRVLDWSDGSSDPKGLYQQLAVVVDDLKTLLARVVRDEVRVDGVPLALVRSLKDATNHTDWDRLVPRLAALACDAFAADEDGTAVPFGVFAERLALAVADVGGLTPSKTPRRGALKKWNLDPDEFIEKNGGRPSVRWKAK